MRNISAKTFFYICTGCLCISIIAIGVMRRDVDDVKSMEQYNDVIVSLNINRPSDIIYILQWTPGGHSPFNFMGQGRSMFTKNGCNYTNCYVTDDRKYFRDYRYFHAIVFNGREVVKMSRASLPKIRVPQQKYIFGTMESAHYYPVCSTFLNGFFNWTWSYRLDSDVRWGYITFFHLNGTIAGPKFDMVWPEMRGALSDDVKNKLKDKVKAVAWFVSNCHSKNNRTKVAKKLSKELKRYKLRLDIYGSCGKYHCPRWGSGECFNMLERDYYFYLAFENSFAEDYVTEKVLNALNHYTVPIVYGMANYSRFLPPGSYLDAMELEPKVLADKINSIIKNKTEYEDYFRWTNHYTYRETSEKEDICNLCALLNDNTKYETYSVVKDFRKWWNGADGHCQR